MIITLVIGFIFLHMCAFWLWYRATNNPSVVDIGWASGLTLSGLIYLNSQMINYRTLLLSLILMAWGSRLGLYLWFTRIRHNKVDKRYTSLSENWKIAKPLGFFINFQLQGLLIFIVSLPWLFASMVRADIPNLLDWLAFVLSFFAIIMESLADYQLQRFKNSNTGKVCKQGLWRYSRHPNYFFEWLTWCAFTLFSLSHPFGWITVVSPLTLYLIMTKITGPMTEKGSIESKGETYVEYQKKTPMFFLNPFKNI
ncbi:DUF1295 domain-containing protein [Legionella israelensis]|uniref:3-oxo-5-alpha-steroid 4-dehydrogenase n=1 Tax=Legionella israelensis TaxID=454 RepID=A0A0W0VK67_9GAMM|nr:DUF1295 domain-containing protein [Legionella israelensis]KTD20230.1 3-oxo-5-alpha-steroid 4-dehydrogenase [Legionella israelensis]QBS09016.1 DUF1295 domain-containing protein [Legionella israelensis]SCY39820.1 Steroid 5-alpha reductase family enzyme [Legionella israelensis DSM 19235]STX58722.1 Predicted membrane protein [Legionella israelensis]